MVHAQLQLSGFQLSLPKGFLEVGPYFMAESCLIPFVYTLEEG